MLQNLKETLGLTDNSEPTTEKPATTPDTPTTEPTHPDPNEETAANAVYNHFHNLDLLDLTDNHADDTAYTTTTIALPDDDALERGLSAAFESVERLMTDHHAELQKRFGRDITLSHEYTEPVTITHDPSNSTVKLKIIPIDRHSADSLYFLIDPTTNEHTTFLVESHSTFGLYNANYSTVDYDVLLTTLSEFSPAENFTTNPPRPTGTIDLPDLHGTALRTDETDDNIELTVDVPNAPTESNIISILAQFGTIEWESRMTRTAHDTDTNRRKTDWQNSSILLADPSLTITFHPTDNPIDSHLTITPIVDPCNYTEKTHTHLWATWSFNTTANPVEYSYVIELSKN